jgi:type IV pilus assembly protein PilP
MADMMNKFLLLLVILSVMGFAGCKGKETPPKPSAEKHRAAAPEAAAPQKEEQKEDANVYTYESKGRRDPFMSLITATKEKMQRKKRANPIENFDVDEIRLIAIVWDKQGSYAMITLPDGKSYTIRKGITLGLYGGKVEDITKDSVLIREQVKDYRGQLKTKDTQLKLRKEGEE